MRRTLLAPGGSIMNAERRAALIDAIEAIIGADARTNFALAVFDDLLDYMRLRHMGARHANHIELAGGDGVPRRGDVRDPSSMKGWELCRGSDLAGEVEMRRAWHALDRYDVGQRRVSVDMAADDVEKVDHAALLQASRYFEPIVFGQPADGDFIRAIPDADDEFGADALPDRRKRLEGESKAIVERTAIGRGEVIGERGPELVHKMAVSLEFDSVEACRLHPLGGVSVFPDDPFDIPIFHLLRKGAMRRLALMRRR